MTFIKNTSHLSFFLTFTFLSGPSMAMEEDNKNVQSFVLLILMLTGQPLLSIVLKEMKVSEGVYQ